MDHVAIMRKSWRFTEKILNREKGIESRWYASKRAPWDMVKKGEWIYFKDSGEAIMLRAKVSRVLQFENLNPKKVREILHKFGNALGVPKEKIPDFFKLFCDKRYCILLFLEHPQKIKPFSIHKKGFGMMAAWISVENITTVKIIDK